MFTSSGAPGSFGGEFYEGPADADGMGALDEVFDGPAPGSAAATGQTPDVSPADAALGAAMDSAMDQGGAPGSAAEAHAAGFEDAASFAAAQEDDQDQDDSGSDIA
jgi:hypothetical protein